jgi:hypothetical protein
MRRFFAESMEWGAHLAAANPRPLDDDTYLESMDLGAPPAAAFLRRI